MAHNNPCSASASMDWNIVESGLLNQAFFNRTTWSDPAVVVRGVSGALNSTTFSSALSISSARVNQALAIMLSCANKANVTTLWTSSYKACCATPKPTPPILVDCTANNYEAELTWLGILLSLIFVIMTSFLTKRKQFAYNCCGGRPGPVVPLNMLDSFENRFGYAAAFGATSVKVISIFIGSYSDSFGFQIDRDIRAGRFPVWANVLLQMAAAAMLAIAFLPFFVCLTRKTDIVFCVCGLIYAALWIILPMVVQGSIFSCLVHQSAVSALAVSDIVLQLPVQVCLLVLFCMFVRNTVCWFRAKKKLHVTGADQVGLDSSWKEGHLYKHVSYLVNVEFKRKNDTSKSKHCVSKKERMNETTQKATPQFKFSLRVVFAFFVSSLSVYVLVLIFIYLAYILFDMWLVPYTQTEAFESAMAYFNLSNYVAEIRMDIAILRVTLYLSVAVTTVLMGLIFLNMLRLYRKNMLQLRKGDRSWMPECVTKMTVTRASLMAASMKYAGYQVGYVFWSYAVLGVILWIVFAITGIQLLGPIFHGHSSVLLRFMARIWPTFLIALILHYGQELIAYVFFLRDKESTFFINNRNAFHIASYFLFFFNVILGFISCILRIFKGIVIGTLFLCRLQKCLLPGGFERHDPGYFAYLGFVLLEHAHTSPVLFVFTRLLDEDLRVKKLRSRHTNWASGVTSINTDTGDDECMQILERNDSWIRARNKWQLLRMLSANPSLAKLRRNGTTSPEVSRRDDATLHGSIGSAEALLVVV